MSEHDYDQDQDQLVDGIGLGDATAADQMGQTLLVEFLALRGSRLCFVARTGHRSCLALSGGVNIV